MANEVRIHIDTLEYTREGLKTRDNVSLPVGEHTKVVLVRPQRVRPSGTTVAAFAAGTAFPGPPVVATFLSAKAAQTIGGWFAKLFGDEAVEQTGVFQVFGHGDSDSDDATSKALSDRRAEIFSALLVGDVDKFAAAASEEHWGLAEHQAMLRVLQCDPGPIDGQDGALTQAAVRDFQADYVHGFFHAESETDPRNPKLAIDGSLGPQTTEALLEAFTTACSPRIEEDRLHPTHPSAGCASFNRITSEAPHLNSRATLVVLPHLPEHHDQAPCTSGDHAVCPFDDRSESGCLWYREHVEELREADCEHGHYDLRWLPLANGRVLLSALTTLPDGAEVTFQLHRSKSVTSADEVIMDDIGEPLSEPSLGIVRRGVAQLVWDPEGLDVFDATQWFRPIPWELTVSDPEAAWDAENQLRVPVFTVRGGGSTALSGPPARQLHQLRVEEEGAASKAPASWVVDDSGHFREVPLSAGRADLFASIRRGARSVLGVLVDGARPTPPETGA